MPDSPRSFMRRVRLSPDVDRLLRLVAASEGVSVSEYVRSVIAADLRERGVLPHPMATKEE